MPAMTSTLIRTTIVLALITMTGCGDGDDAAPAGTDAAVAPSMPLWEGPSAEFTVTVDDPATNFEWAVTVPTGGWEIKFDGARVDPRAQHAVIRVILRAPDPDLDVTQALETLQGNYRHGNLTARTAELFIEQVVGDETADGDHRSAATWSDGS